MKTYVITLSKVFPTNHQLAGVPTFFKTKLENANVIPFDETNRQPAPDGHPQLKLHTIRANYPLWKKRFEQIERGEACLSIRQWSGKPYASKQIELCKLTKKDGIGLQELSFGRSYNGYSLLEPYIDGHGIYLVEQIASNDGLRLDDWYTWFCGCDLSKPFALIQFTKFRY